MKKSQRKGIPHPKYKGGGETKIKSQNYKGGMEIAYKGKNDYYASDKK
jgi:hypothetical protein